VRRAATVGAIVFVLATGVTPAVAASGDISVSASAPSEATVSETVRVQFEVTNDGAEPTDALGLQVESLPPGFEVVGIESSGAVASERNAVFWTEPVQPGESVSAVVSVRVTEAAPGDRGIRAVAATNETETQATARLSVRSRTTPTQTAAPTDTTTGGGETPGNGGAADGSSGGLPTIEPLTAVAALGVVVVLLLLR